MKHLEYSVEISNGLVVGDAIDRLSVCWLDEFKVPCREIIPKEFIDKHQGFGQTIFAEKILQFVSNTLDFRIEPFTSLK